jgi:hypothetical protein
VANNIPFHGLLFPWKAMRGPIELTPELEFGTTGKGSFWMTDTNQQASNGDITDGSEQHPSGALPGADQRPPIDEVPEPAEKPTFVFAAIAVALGILAGVVFAAIALRPHAPNGPNDLGLIISNTDGLKGHLILNWGEKLGYSLVIEPNDPGQLAEFSLAITSPPRPLSIDIQLKNYPGSVLCTKTILLKYEPGQPAALAPANSGSQTVHTNSGNVSLDQKAQANDIAQLEALELQREHGQDIFQNDIGQDGQTESVTSQGEIPCSRQAYEHTVSWSFSSNFPTLDERTELLKRQADLRADASVAVANKAASAASAARKKAKKKAPEDFLAFAIEGDDELVGYDPAKGLIETSTRKTFIVDKTNGAFNTAAWGDIPANIHYKCDLKAACTLSRRGATVLYARLMK